LAKGILRSTSMIIYSSLKRLFYRTVRLYFRTVCIEGPEHIPQTGPVIFVANHNSAFMDPIVLGVHIKRPLYFLARGESFSSKLINWFFGQLNMIPLYRPEVAPNQMHKNKQAFERSYTHLQQGKTILIFPEAFSEPVRRLRPLRTGTARIALGAVQQSGYALEVRIVPVGINYTDAHHRGKDLLLYIGKPLSTKEYIHTYQADAREAVRQLTADISEGMARLLVDIKDPKLDKLVGRLETLHFDNPDPDNCKRVWQHFKRTRHIVEVLTHAHRQHPGQLDRLDKKVEHYLARLDEYAINDQQIMGSVASKPSVIRLLYLLFGAPISLYGALTNFLPYLTVKALSAAIKVRADFIGSKKLALGSFLFPIFYLLQTVAFALLTKGYWFILFALSLYPAARFTVSYLRKLSKLKTDLRFRRLNKSEKQKIRELKELREEIGELLSGEWKRS